MRKAQALLGAMRKMRSPDNNWARVRDDYVGLYEEILALIVNEDPPDNVYALRRGTEIMQ